MRSDHLEESSSFERMKINLSTVWALQPGLDARKVKLELSWACRLVLRKECKKGLPICKTVRS